MSEQDKVSIRTEPVGMATRVIGMVGTHEVITLSNSAGGVWTVGSSSCLPTDIQRAGLFIECMQRAHARAREHGAP
ncbi:hypothetical protein [Ottowia sp.]|uniref:hypothetical protein n=1 Tax=Ottowia sp. TaxID=1898956 RepID=UPI0025D56ADD|nr:hypothetical protein [Ottowia sp.]MBK6616296.1 hypothetical protein [Ottowia sp.]